MMWRRSIGLCIALLAMGSSTAWAAPMSLVQAWQAAKQYDPNYQAAISEREAGQAERALGRAGLLPQVTGTVGRTRIRGDLDTPNAQGQIINQDLHYTSKVNDLSAQQMLFDWDAIQGYRQGHAKADLALATFDTHVNENSERLINRYFQLLLAHQQAQIAQNNLQATQKHIDIAQRHFERGEGTITAVHEAISRRDMAQAGLLMAQDNVVIARRELQEMVGTDPWQVYGLRADLHPERIQPDYLEAWMEMAMERNAQIRAASQDLRVNALEIQRAFSGHLPTVHLTGSWRKTEGETLSTRNQESSTRSVGVQVNLPVFSGGRTQAQVNQAQHHRDQSQHEMEAVREQIAVEVTRQFQGVVSGAQHITALEKAVESSRLAVQASERGYQGGTRSIRDILDAQDRLYNAELDLTKARLDYVRARLMLAAVADGLDGGLMEQVTQQFFSQQPITVELTHPNPHS